MGISSIRFLTVLLEKDTVSSFAAASTQITVLIKIIAAGITRDSQMASAFMLFATRRATSSCFENTLLFLVNHATLV